MGHQLMQDKGWGEALGEKNGRDQKGPEDLALIQEWREQTRADSEAGQRQYKGEAKMSSRQGKQSRGSSGQYSKLRDIKRRKMSGWTPKINTTEKQPRWSLGIHTPCYNDSCPQTNKQTNPRPSWGKYTGSLETYPLWYDRVLLLKILLSSARALKLRHSCVQISR